MQNLFWYDALTNSCFCACENDIWHFQDKVKNSFEEKEQPMMKIGKHAAICKELTDLYERKNADYGDSFAELRKEFPNSITYRLTDKLNRLKKLYDPEHQQQVKDESVDDTLKDIANYAILELIERGYKLVTISEMAEAKNVKLQNAPYTDFWNTSLASGIVPGYQGGDATTISTADTYTGDGSETFSTYAANQGTNDSSSSSESSDESYDESYEDSYEDSYDESYDEEEYSYDEDYEEG